VAEDSLRLGLVVIADSVNPIHITRAAWLHDPERDSTRAVEVQCSDSVAHQWRTETHSNSLSRMELRANATLNS
jgi:predicted kinase